MNSPTDWMSPSSAPELRAQFRLRRTAVAGPHGIDEDEIGPIEPGLVVVYQLVGRGGHTAVRTHLHPSRTERAEVQPDRRRSRPAVEREHQRPLRHVSSVVKRVRHEEEPRLDVAGCGLDWQVSRRGGVFQRAAVDAHLVMRHDRRIVGLARCRGRLLDWRCLRLVLRGRTQHHRHRDDQHSSRLFQGSHRGLLGRDDRLSASTASPHRRSRRRAHRRRKRP